MENQTFEIVVAGSNIDWIGRKVTGTHNGTIGVKSGVLNFAGGKLTGGQFTVDTTSIKILDVTDPATNVQFAGHLASADFFASEQYPEAKLVITSVTFAGNNTYVIKGDLTIKGISHPVAFVSSININGDSLSATGKIIIDRTQYDMKFRSGNFFKDLGDTLIYNDFELQMNIVARSVSELVNL